MKKQFRRMGRQYTTEYVPSSLSWPTQTWVGISISRPSTLLLCGQLHNGPVLLLPGDGIKFRNLMSFQFRGALHLT